MLKRLKRFIRPILWIMGIAVLAAFGAGTVAYRHFTKIAAQFDLTQVGQMEKASVIFDREGNPIGQIFVQNRHWTPLAGFSPVVIHAVVAAEDKRFFQHSGADYFGIGRAAVRNSVARGVRQGASTITQQLARNTFELKARSFERKGIEIFLARRIERTMSKDQILECYLNLVYLGSGCYGFESAARGYFDKSASALTAPEAALLASLIKSPNRLSPRRNPKDATASRNMVLRLMAEQGTLSPSALAAAIQVPLNLRDEHPFTGESYAIEAVRQQTVAALGFLPAAKSGFRIYTTIDSTLQRTATDSLVSSLAKVEATPGYNRPTLESYREAHPAGEISPPVPDYLQGAVLAIDNRSGAILAMVGGRSFENSEFNRTLMSRRSAGTAFTPFVYAAALEYGASPATLLEDEPMDNRLVMMGGETGILGEWGVERDDNHYEGKIPSREAIAHGKNAAVVRLGYTVGVPGVQVLAKRCGISSPLTEYPSSYLGSSGVSLAEMTLAFTSFAGEGTRPKSLHIVERIVDSSGAVIFEASTQTDEAMKPEIAYQTHLALRDTLRSGTASAAYTDYGLGDFEAGGKTGTSYGFTDNWFVGYDSTVTCGVWVGYDSPTPIFRGAFSKDTALPVWVDVINAAATQIPPSVFPRPANLLTVTLCRKSGMQATDNCRLDPGSVYEELLTAEQSPQKPCDVHNEQLRDYLKPEKATEWPRAVPIDRGEASVAMLSPTVIGFDPYHSVIAVNTHLPAPAPAAPPATEETPPVRRALPDDYDDAEAMELSNPPATGAKAEEATKTPEATPKPRPVDPMTRPMGEAPPKPKVDPMMQPMEDALPVKRALPNNEGELGD